LKKIGRDDVQQYLYERAKEALGRHDFSPLDAFLADDWGQRSLGGWLNQQYGLQIDPAAFQDKSPEEAQAVIHERIQELYHDKEISFPVSVGLHNFLADSPGGDKYDRDGLVHWASHRFHAQLDGESLKNKQRQQIEELLTQASRRYFGEGETIARIDEFLERAYGDGERRNGQSNGHGDGRKTMPADNAALNQMIDWAREQFQLSLDGPELAQLDREQARQKLLQAFDVRFRPELSQAERALILEVLDNAWKDHLYYMDHLRSGIGLVGYAQKDPKVEYKREGMKAFDQMWDRIGDQVTGAIFRLEKESPQFVGSLWRITGLSQPAPPPAAKQTAREDYTASHGELEPGQEVRTIEPIRHHGERIGRNDPGPCGSGKKYKKCCGAT
jgi:preprotein translocase subunit SecA